MNTELFPPEFFNLLRTDTVLSGRAGQNIPGGMFRLENQVGESQDFFDYRPYGQGDDIRFVDWNIFRRCRRLFVRKYQASPRDAHVISLDSSPSVTCSDIRAFTVWRTGAWLAAKLLRMGETVELRIGGAGHQFCGISRDLMVTVCEFLSGAYEHRHNAGNVDWRIPTRKQHWIISDFYGDGPLEKWLEHLRSCNFLPVRIFEPGEENPEFAGPCCLRDVESGRRVTLEINARALQEYHRNLRRFEEALAATASRQGMPLVKVRAELSLTGLFEQLEGCLGEMK